MNNARTFYFRDTVGASDGDIGSPLTITSITLVPANSECDPVEFGFTLLKDPKEGALFSGEDIVDFVNPDGQVIPCLIYQHTRRYLYNGNATYKSIGGLKRVIDREMPIDALRYFHYMKRFDELEGIMS